MTSRHSWQIGKSDCSRWSKTATGKAAYTVSVAEEGEDVEFDPDTIEAEKTVAFA
jgi:hypothetical protein